MVCSLSCVREVNGLSNEMLKLQQMLLPRLPHEKLWDRVTMLVIAIWEKIIIYNSGCYRAIKQGESGVWMQNDYRELRHYQKPSGSFHYTWKLVWCYLFSPSKTPSLFLAVIYIASILDGWLYLCLFFLINPVPHELWSCLTIPTINQEDWDPFVLPINCFSLLISLVVILQALLKLAPAVFNRGYHALTCMVCMRYTLPHGSEVDDPREKCIGTAEGDDSEGDKRTAQHFVMGCFLPKWFPRRTHG